MSRPSRARELKQLYAEEVERGMLGKIQKAIDASPALQPERELIDAFINAYNADGGQPDWTAFVAEKLDKDVESLAGQYGMDTEKTRSSVMSGWRRKRRPDRRNPNKTHRDKRAKLEERLRKLIRDD